MKQDLLAFRLPPDEFPPVSGKNAQARQASRSGAVLAHARMGDKSKQILALLAQRPRSRQDVAEASGLMINAVCSLMASLEKRGVIEACEQEMIIWPPLDPDDPEEVPKVTYRMVYRVRAVPQ